MSSTIQIKFLTLEEMANASKLDPRYSHVGIDNLGFADKQKNRVFVRADVVPELQRYLIDHELEHLWEMEGTDEDENGIRHKKKGGFMKVFAPIALAVLGSILVPGLGTMLGGSLGGLLGGATGVGLGAGLGGVAGSSATGKPNWLGNTIGGATAGLTAGALSGLGAGSAGGSGLSSTGSGSISFAPGSISGGSVGSIVPASAIEGGITGATGSGIAGSSSSLSNLFAGAIGAGTSAFGSSRPTSSSSSYRNNPDFSQFGKNSDNLAPSYSGWSQDVAMPQNSFELGGTGAEPMAGVGERYGQSNLPLQGGLNQPGLMNYGKEMTTPFGQIGQKNQSMDEMFQPGFQSMGGF